MWLHQPPICLPVSECTYYFLLVVARMLQDISHSVICIALLCIRSTQQHGGGGTIQLSLTYFGSCYEILCSMGLLFSSYHRYWSTWASCSHFRSITFRDSSDSVLLLHAMNSVSRAAKDFLNLFSVYVKHTMAERISTMWMTDFAHCTIKIS